MFTSSTSQSEKRNNGGTVYLAQSGQLPNTVVAEAVDAATEVAGSKRRTSGRSRFVFTAAVIIIVLGGIRLFLEACQLVYQLKSYLFDWLNWIEVTLYILSIIFVAVFRTTCLCPHVWQWQIGVVVIFLAWINLIIVCAKFPNIGIYVIMFGKILGGISESITPIHTASCHIWTHLLHDLL